MTIIVFVTLFCIAQISLFKHQTSHENNEAQAACLICIFSPDQINDTSLPLSSISIHEEVMGNQGCYDFTSLVHVVYYLTRAPPVC